MLTNFLKNVGLLGCLFLFLTAGESRAHFSLSGAVFPLSNEQQSVDSTVEYEIWEDFREYADLECTIPRRLENASVVANASTEYQGLALFSLQALRLNLPYWEVYADLQPCHGFLFHYTPF
jgi:hypothetical protein